VKQRVLDLVKQRNDTIDHGPSYVMPEVCASLSACLEFGLTGEFQMQRGGDEWGNNNIKDKYGFWYENTGVR